MFKRGLSLVAVLAMASMANAGAVVELRIADELGNPVSPTNQDGTWDGGENVVVEMWVTADDTFVIRSAQIDYRSSSPELILGKDIDSVNQPFDGVPNFWFDYSRSVNGVGTYPAMGEGDDGPTTGDYVDFSNLTAGVPAVPFPPSTASGRTTHSATRMIEVAAGVPFRLGGMPTTLPAADPTAVRTYTLDLLGADANNVNNGTAIGFGFGSAAVGDKPVTLWSTAINDPTVNSPIAYAPGRAGPIQFVVVPEPATLAILALGGLAAALRRRRTA
jgi:hypothetical protein